MPKTQIKRPERVRARSDRLDARISAEQKALFQRAASLQGRTLTDFVIASVHDAALRTIQDMEVIRLGRIDSEAFARALLQPRSAKPAFREAARRYRSTSAE